MASYTTLRVYRDDNMLYPESEYVAVVDNRDCYLVEPVSVGPDWTHVRIRFLKPIWTSDPGLLDNTVSAREGWHFLLESEYIDEVQNWEVVEQRPVADVIIEQIPGYRPALRPKEQRISPMDTRPSDEHMEALELAKIALTYINPMPERAGDNPPYPYHFVGPLANRFTKEQLREGIEYLMEGKTVEFRYEEYGREEEA